MYINKRAMLSNVYDICTVVAHLRVSHAQWQSVKIHQLVAANLFLSPCVISAPLRRNFTSSFSVSFIYELSTLCEYIVFAASDGLFYNR